MNFFREKHLLRYTEELSAFHSIMTPIHDQLQAKVGEQYLFLSDTVLREADLFEFCQILSTLQEPFL